jgi:hypothetical protein
MKRIAFLCLYLWLCATADANAQSAESVIPSRYAFHFTRVMLSDGSIRAGWLVGTIRDSVVLQVGSKSERVARTDLVRVEIDTKPNRSTPTLIGLIMGVYAGNALALKAEGQPILFLRDHDTPLAIAAYSALFGLAGGAVGYLTSGAESDETIIDFAQGEEETRLAGSQEEGSRRSAIHLSIQASSVSGPLPKSDSYGYYGYTSAVSWNMLRRLQLTYSVAEYAEVGLAIMWLGQPSIGAYGYLPGWTSMFVSFDGNGYYAVGVFQPLWKLTGRNVRWDVGAGAGLASFDFSGSSWTNTFEGQSVIASVAARNNAFSALAYTELKFFLSDYFTIGLTADVVLTSERVPALNGMTLESSTLGTTSVGVAFGFHM